MKKNINSKLQKFFTKNHNQAIAAYAEQYLKSHPDLTINDVALCHSITMEQPDMQLKDLFWFEKKKEFLAGQVLLLIKKERERQTQLWGKQTYKNPLYWLGILTEEVGEFAQAANETMLENAKKKHLGGPDNMANELIQIAAVAVAAAEDILEQKENKNGRR
jgi:NTP pyrophosphatase (non-canonical NTP hydrolase)